MNILLKFLPIVDLIERSIFSSLLANYNFDAPIEDHAIKFITDNNSQIKLSFNIPAIDNVLDDNIDLDRTELSKLIELIAGHHMSLESGVKRYDYSAMLVFLTVIYTDITRNIDKINAEYSLKFDEIAKEYANNKCTDLLLKGIIRIYISDILKRKDSTNTALLDFLKRYRYRENIFCKFEPFFYESDWSLIIENYLFNFRYYAEVVYSFFFEFYIRSDNPVRSTALDLLNRSNIGFDSPEDESELMSHIDDICINDADDKLSSKSNFEISCGDIDNIHSSETDFSFNINDIKFDSYLEFSIRTYTSKPLEHQLEELEIFKNNVSVYLSAIYKSIANNTININLGTEYKFGSDYIRDASGKIVDRENIDKLFTRWQRYLDIYDLKKSGRSLSQIVSKMSTYEEYGGTPKTTAEASKDYKEAERLILSASALTFPY